MAVYQHVLPGMQRDAADMFAKLIGDAVTDAGSPAEPFVVPVDAR